MRTIQPTKAYRRDYSRIKSNPRYKNIDDFLNPVLEMLARDRLCRCATAIMTCPGTGAIAASATSGPTSC
jgi:hypothetical protein